MKIDLQKSLDSAQGNAFPGMIEDLGKHLGVSADSLRRLGLGWMPFVKFKDKLSYCGWWAIPLWDQRGLITGIALRNQDDAKVSYPGGKVGLFYEVNPDHVAGSNTYAAGPANWVRSMGSGYNCPVCHKPDGCLLSAENPADPKAVICIRVKSPREMRLGFLHKLKGNENAKSTSILLPSDHPILCVEGYTDVAAAMDLGFVAVGRPGNLTGLDILADVLRGRDVIVVGENDKKSDGSQPGETGMNQAWECLRHTAKSAKMLMPPAGVKDLRAWYTTHGLTQAELISYIGSRSSSTMTGNNLPDRRWPAVTKAFLDARFKSDGLYSMWKWRGDLWVYRSGAYTKLPDTAYTSAVDGWAMGIVFTESDLNTGKPVSHRMAADTTMRREMFAAFDNHICIPADARVPRWLREQTHNHDANDLIVFPNGLLNAPMFVAGAIADDYWLPPTPELFAVSPLAVPFDANAECPQWEYFLRSSLPDDPDAIMLLQEWFGYCLTSDTSYAKMMFMFGQRRSGKGTIIDVLTWILGSSVKAGTFTGVSNRFGLEPLAEAQLITFPDIRVSDGPHVAAGVERLLSISGNDMIEVPIKYGGTMSVRILARIFMASNGLLKIEDESGALESRLLIIPFRVSFADNPDPTLRARVRTELPGIVNWALRGLFRLRQQGRFTQPASHMESVREWRLMVSASASFCDECLESADRNTFSHKDEVFAMWDAWRNEKRLHPMTKSSFWNKVRTHCSSVVDGVVGTEHVFFGLRMKKDAARKYLGKI